MAAIGSTWVSGSWVSVGGWAAGTWAAAAAQVAAVPGTGLWARKYPARRRRGPLTGSEPYPQERISAETIALREAREKRQMLRLARELQAGDELIQQARLQERNKKTRMENAITRLKREALGPEPTPKVEPPPLSQFEQDRLKNLEKARGALKQKKAAQEEETIRQTEHMATLREKNKKILLDAAVANLKRETWEKERASNPVLQLEEWARQDKIKRDRAANLTIAQAAREEKQERERQLREQRLANLSKVKKKRKGR